jgi:hypothetical protein
MGYVGRAEGLGRGMPTRKLLRVKSKAFHGVVAEGIGDPGPASNEAAKFDPFYLLELGDNLDGA